jgi:hypothetical protein
VKHLLLLFQLGSLVIAFLVTRALLPAIMHELGRKSDQALRLFTTPVGSAVLFGITFVAVWFGLSLLAVVGWLLLRKLI